MEAICKKYKIKRDLLKSIQKIKYKNNKQILAAAKILDAFTSYIQLKEMVRLSDQPLISKIENFIEDNLSDELSVEKICKHFSIGRTQLYELTKKELNKGVATLIREKKLEKAKILLKKTDLKIPEVSYKVGFSDYNYFLRVFKKEYSISPKKYKTQF